LENLVEEMGNSRNKKVILYLNEFPVLSISGIKTPFEKIWVNIFSIAVFPIGIIIYLRAMIFRIRLNKNLAKIRVNSNNIIKLLKKQYTI
jgi:lipopolysaccharide export system permease protein